MKATKQISNQREVISSDQPNRVIVQIAKIAKGCDELCAHNLQDTVKALKKVQTPQIVRHQVNPEVSFSTPLSMLCASASLLEMILLPRCSVFLNYSFRCKKETKK